MTKPVCARCGLTQDRWRGQRGEGVVGEDGKTYCCVTCSAGQACTCLEVLQEEVLLEDDVKGPAEEPASMEHASDYPLKPGQVGHGSGTTGSTSAPRVYDPPTSAS
jgi:hypothetical protein